MTHNIDQQNIINAAFISSMKPPPGSLKNITSMGQINLEMVKGIREFFKKGDIVVILQIYKK